MRMAGIIESANLLYVFLTDHIYSKLYNAGVSHNLLLTGLNECYGEP